jgi:Fatty acid desaturase
MSAAAASERRSILRHSSRDALPVGFALAHAAVLFLAPVGATVALGLWWNANTVSHHFIHKPYFRSQQLNGLFSCHLSLLLGLPQTLWRDRHLAHHAGVAWRLKISPQLVLETGLVLGLWATLLLLVPRFFWAAYLPGFAAGLGLCWLQGHYEHARGTVSHYGWLYNRLFLNDGYHIEHHLRPSTHWSDLPRVPSASAPVSRWPAILRWLEMPSLENLERLVLRSRLLQRLVLDTHERAFRRLLPEVGPVCRVGIVGGGLFPRTALILRRLLPEAQLIVIDADAANIQTARSFPLDGTEFIEGRYDPERHTGFDLVVIPLAYVGDKDVLRRSPPAPNLLVHEWLWRRGQRSAIVSRLLLKRLVLVKR